MKHFKKNPPTISVNNIKLLLLYQVDFFRLYKCWHFSHRLNWYLFYQFISSGRNLIMKFYDGYSWFYFGYCCSDEREVVHWTLVFIIINILFILYLPHCILLTFFVEKFEWFLWSEEWNSKTERRRYEASRSFTTR